MSTPTKEQIEKLPKWAQEHIRDIERERDSSRLQLDAYLDAQTESPFFVDDMVCDESPPRFVRRYVQTHKMTVVHEGIQLDVILPNGVQNRHGIEISWGTPGRACGDVMFQPASFQQARLLPVEVKK